jgi:hypothetical protein
MRAIIYAALLVHSWYPPGCCGDKHCKPVPCTEISRTDQGYDWSGFHFDPNQVHPTKDNQCHACVIGHSPACLFIELSS